VTTATQGTPATPASPDAAALTSAVDLIKVLTSLATGALVFSIGLNSPTGFAYLPRIKDVLIASWILLFLAVASGVYAQGLAPNQIRNNRPNINSGELRAAVMAQEAFFVLGILGIATALVSALLGAPTKLQAAIETPMAAVRSATDDLSPHDQLDKVAIVELIKGLDASRPDEQTWHVQFAVSDGSNSATRDVYLDAVTGQVYSPTTPK
jgi:hypothetical protein